jgi:phosphoglycerate dehydrogenase-like enzyme
MTAATVVVTFEPGRHGRTVIPDVLGAAATPVWLVGLDDQARAAALTAATAILARDTGKELRAHEPALTGGAKLIQFMTAGVEYVPLSQLPNGVPIAANGGAYAEPMAEHALALVLAAAKRLLIEHNELTKGTFNQFTLNRQVRGMTCGILGFGGIGVATARLMRAVGMRIHAINRRGASDEPTDWIGTTTQLPELLAAADVLIISVPLTRSTTGLIGLRELQMMKPDAILVNLARGEVVDEAALFAHLQANPSFTACIDAWWVEPVRHGAFRMDYPFLSLPNVIGSPHNSGSGPDAARMGVTRAAANIRRALTGQTPLHLVGDEERMM